MLASHAIRARVAAVTWRGKHRISLVCGTGQSIELKTKVYGPRPLVGDELILIDAAIRHIQLSRRTQFRRLFLNFDQQNLEPDGNYGVWIPGHELPDGHSDDFCCLSQMADDWFGVVDDHDLTLLRLHVPSFRIDNQYVPLM